jgi:hypothetical protein
VDEDLLKIQQQTGAIIPTKNSMDDVNDIIDKCSYTKEYNQG